MYTYRKPKNAEHAIELVKLANANVRWDICIEGRPDESQRYFDMYKPIVFIYKDEKLIAAAHGIGGRPTVIGLNDTDITKTFNKLVLMEIDTELKQLELDF
jgi:hypothetical protein